MISIVLGYLYGLILEKCWIPSKQMILLHLKSRRPPFSRQNKPQLKCQRLWDWPLNKKPCSPERLEVNNDTTLKHTYLYFRRQRWLYLNCCAEQWLDSYPRTGCCGPDYGLHRTLAESATRMSSWHSNAPSSLPFCGVWPRPSMSKSPEKCGPGCVCLQSIRHSMRMLILY